MSSSATTSARAAWWEWIGRNVIARVYAFMLVLVICYVSYRAVAYLLRSLLSPTQTPAQIAGVPRRLDEEILHGSRPDWLGLASVENPRSPIARYHRFETWFLHDEANDCTRSGCHGPLPHSERKEVRAFLNMHATSLHCGVCHLTHDASPLPLTWYGVKTGAANGPPALLATAAWLEAHPPPGTPRAWTAAHQGEIVGLLRQAAAEADGEPTLRRIAEHLHAVLPGGPAFARLVDAARDAVPRAFRGSYGSKLALTDDQGQPVLAHPGTAEQVRLFRERGEHLPAAERERLIEAIHPRKRATPLECNACHRASGSLIDFHKLGYPEGRRHALFDPAIFQMITHISEGRPFHLPNVSLPGGATPTTQPTTRP